MAGIDGAFERADRDLERVAGVDQQRVGRRDQLVPVLGLDIGADLPRRIGGRVPERDDLLLQPDLEPAERHRRGGGEFELQPVEPAAKEIAVTQRGDQFVDRFHAAGQRAVDALMRQQHAALQLQFTAQRPQRLAQIAKVRQGCELVKGGDLGGHGGDLAAGGSKGKGSGSRPTYASAKHCADGIEYAK